MIRIISSEPIPGNALRIAVSTDDGTVIRNCRALRRRRDGVWLIDGPAMHARDHVGRRRWVPLVELSPKMREAIAAALDAAIPSEVAA